MAGHCACSSGGMSYVITQKCVGTCDTACVEVCPVDAIDGPVTIEHLNSLEPTARAALTGTIQMYIDPEVCVLCNACESACPAGAIYLDDEVPPAYEQDIAANEAFFRGQ